MTTDPEDCFEVLVVDIAQFDRLLDEFLGLVAVEESGRDFIPLCSFDGARVQRSRTTFRGSEYDVETSVGDDLVRMGSFSRPPSSRFPVFEGGVRGENEEDLRVCTHSSFE